MFMADICDVSDLLCKPQITPIEPPPPRMAAIHTAQPVNAIKVAEPVQVIGLPVCRLRCLGAHLGGISSPLVESGYTVREYS